CPAETAELYTQLIRVRWHQHRTILPRSGCLAVLTLHRCFGMLATRGVDRQPVRRWGRMGTSDVVGALQKESQGRPFRVASHQRLATFLVVGAVSPWLGTMGFAIWLLWQAWTTGTWDEFWKSVLPLLPALFFLWRVRASEWKEQAALREGARALRWAAA